MPRSGQIIPKYDFPHSEFFLNDNTGITNIPSSSSGECYVLFVFISPKGVSNKIQSITNGLEGFVGEYGNGSFAIYGQPLMNAYTCAASGAAKLHCLRVTAANSRFANVHIYAKYKVETKITGQDDNGNDITKKELTVKFYSKSTPDLGDLSLLGEYGLDLMGDLKNNPDDDDYNHLYLFSAAAQGQGIYGNSYRIQLVTSPTYDKEVDFDLYKNYYFRVYESGSAYTMIDEFPVIFNPDALIQEQSMFLDDIINDVDNGSKYIKTNTNFDGISKLYEIYSSEIVPDTNLTLETFDPFLGINKITKGAIEGYNIDTTDDDTFILNKLTGVALGDGSDGDFGIDVDPAKRRAAIDEAYVNAFSGITDPDIKSRRKYPVNIIFDANYSLEVKKLIGSLATTRTDCMAIIDCGTNLIGKKSALDYQNNLGEFVSERVHMVDAIYGQVKDPYSKKIVTVTDTYFLASAYPISFKRNGGKHVPVAGCNLGILTGFIKGSIKPVYDQDVDADIMQELVEKRVNYAALTTKGDICRHTQTTRQSLTSDLSEANAVFVTLDVKRDCEHLVEEYEYNFSESSEMARFNKDASEILSVYNEQVKTITGRFEKNEFEAARNILHMYVDLSHKDLVKTTLIELDVN